MVRKKKKKKEAENDLRIEETLIFSSVYHNTVLKAYLDLFHVSCLKTDINKNFVPQFYFSSRNQTDWRSIMCV